MLKIIRVLLLKALAVIFLMGCGDRPPDLDLQAGIDNAILDKNLLSGLTTADLKGFSWINTPGQYEIQNGRLSVTAPGNSDFFVNPIDLNTSNSAPVLYKEIAGDFVAITQVSPDFSSVWNAAAIMVFIDDSNWIKFGFENSDATGPGIVTVITRGISDDANGVVLNDKDHVWLKIVRKDNNYAMHWSLDGVDYHMARLSAMPPADQIRIGLEAQCPSGNEAKHKFNYLSIESRTIEDLRAGE